jgi:hypothetical protein
MPVTCRPLPFTVEIDKLSQIKILSTTRFAFFGSKQSAACVCLQECLFGLLNVFKILFKSQVGFAPTLGRQMITKLEP